MRTRVCITVTAGTTAELRRRRDEVADADLVELRLDAVSDPNVGGALAGRRVPVVVTCRPAWEGGRFTGSEEERRRLLGEAVALGAEYVDVEWRAGFDDLVARTAGRRVILSSHDFDGVPADLEDRIRAMRSTGAEVVKVAVQARRLSDALALFTLGPRVARDGAVVLIGMGEAGVATRVLASRIGSAWTYAGDERAVGQLSAAALLDLYRFRSIGDATEVYGLVGQPVAHSVSPAMHNTAFQAIRRDAVYLPFAAADADDFMTFARGLGVKGASVTTPYKVDLCDRVDEVYSIARRIGAVNTISMVDGRWLGGNTDVGGFLAPLGDASALRGRRASILGAGGSARSVAVALASSGATVRVHARQQSRAELVAVLVDGATGPWPPEPGSWDLLVNCTPIGMHPRVDESPMPAEGLTGDTVYDLVYNPASTRLLADAERAGCRVIGGLEMLVAQARDQFEWWTGTRPPAALMREAAAHALAEFNR